MFYHWEENDLHLFIQVQPKASKDELSEILNNRIKIRITAPPIDGKANMHLIKFLAKLFNLESSVGLGKVCCYDGLWLDVIVQNGCSLLCDYNNAIRHHSGTIYLVALSLYR